MDVSKCISDVISKNIEIIYSYVSYLFSII